MFSFPGDAQAGGDDDDDSEDEEEAEQAAAKVDDEEVQKNKRLEKKRRLKERFDTEYDDGEATYFDDLKEEMQKQAEVAPPLQSQPKQCCSASPRLL